MPPLYKPRIPCARARSSATTWGGVRRDPGRACILVLIVSNGWPSKGETPQSAETPGPERSEKKPRQPSKHRAHKQMRRRDARRTCLAATGRLDSGARASSLTPAKRRVLYDRPSPGGDVDETAPGPAGLFPKASIWTSGAGLLNLHEPHGNEYTLHAVGGYLPHTCLVSCSI